MVINLCLYKLGGIRLVRSSILDGVLGLYIKGESQYSMDRKILALKYGKLFCEAFLSASNEAKIGIDADSDFIFMYVTILSIFTKEDLKKYKGAVEEIYKILIDAEKGKPISNEERKGMEEKLNELYDVFNERVSIKEWELELASKF